MFIYFVDLVESRIFFEFWSTFSASAVRGESRHIGQPFTCTQFGDCVCFFVLLRSSWYEYWRKYAFLDGTRSILSLWDEILPAEEVKKAQRSTTVAAVVVCNICHTTISEHRSERRGKYVEPNRVAFA